MKRWWISHIWMLDHLHTMESARRRGFGKLLIKMWCKEFVKQENADPISYIIADNVPSRKLYESLNFEVFRESWHVRFNTDDWRDHMNFIEAINDARFPPRTLSIFYWASIYNPILAKTRKINRNWSMIIIWHSLIHSTDQLISQARVALTM